MAPRPQTALLYNSGTSNCWLRDRASCQKYWRPAFIRPDWWLRRFYCQLARFCQLPRGLRLHCEFFHFKRVFEKNWFYVFCGSCVSACVSPQIPRQNYFYTNFWAHWAESNAPFFSQLLYVMTFKLPSRELNDLLKIDYKFNFRSGKMSSSPVLKLKRYFLLYVQKRKALITRYLFIDVIFVLSFILKSKLKVSSVTY